MSGCSAASAMCTSAPIQSPPSPMDIRPKSDDLRGLMSIRRSGRITSSFIRSMRVVPPARKCVVPVPLFHACAVSIASRGVAAESNIKGRIALSFACPSSTRAELGLVHGRHDVGISAATADIPAHVLADRSVAFGMPFIHTADGRHDLSRRAIAALKGVMLDKGLLHGMQLAVRTRNSFDRCDRMILDARRKSEARQHAPTVHQHRAGAALSLVATLLGAGQAQVLTQRVKQCCSHIERDAMLALVDLEHEAYGIAGGACAHTLRGRLRARRTPERRHSRGRCGDHEEVPSAVGMRPVGLAITLAHGRAPHSHVPVDCRENECFAESFRQHTECCRFPCRCRFPCSPEERSGTWSDPSRLDQRRCGKTRRIGDQWRGQAVSKCDAGPVLPPDLPPPQMYSGAALRKSWTLLTVHISRLI